ncbi:MAG TPA: TonB-dependent receptor, partial [Nevskiaceae bacterium]|nr:TonB-dependent receptor [Nevskiaceae bacterium]
MRTGVRRREITALAAVVVWRAIAGTPAHGEDTLEAIPATPPATDATAPAADREPRAGTAPGEIVVTASRREQLVEDVVGGLQVFSGEDLEAKGDDSFEDYLTQVAGAGFRQDGSGNTKIGLRGVSNISGNQLGTFSGSSPVGVYLNDVPIQGSGQLPDLDLYDLQRIEVLKGPQGTLYGEGAMGGAIRMIVNSPSLDAFDFKGETLTSWTDHGGFNRGIKLAGGAPLIQERLGVRGVVTSRRESGFIDLPEQDRKDANDVEAESLRLLGTWQATPAIAVDALYLKDHGKVDGSPNVRPETKEELENDILERERARREIDIGGLTVKWDLASMQLAAVSSILRAERHAVFRLPLLKSTIQGNVEDVLAGPLGVIIDPAVIADLAFDVARIREEPFDNQTWDEGFSQELRAVSSGDERFDWVAGVYYQTRDQRYDQTAYAYESPTPGENRNIHRDGVQTLEQLSAYGEGTYEWTPAIEMTMGLRVFRETIGIDDFFASYGAVALVQAAAGDQNPKYLDVEDTYSDVLPKLSFAWHVDDDAMLYALASRGYRTTTPNVQYQLGVGAPLLEADFLWNYELGAKTQWLDRRLALNVAAYYIDWHDLQASRLGEGRLGPLPVDIIFIDNIGDAVIKGVDLEATWAPTPRLILSFGGGYQDGRLVKLAPDSVAVKDSRVPNSPEWTGSAGIDWSVPIDDRHALAFGTRVQYVDEQGTVE